MTAPINVATYSSGYAARTWPTGAAVTGIDANTDDVLVCKAGLEQGGITLATPTGASGLTWVLQQAGATGSDVAPVYLWTATATAGFTGQTITVTGSSGSAWGGVVIRRWSASDGVGASSAANNTTGSGIPSHTLTTTQADSAIDYIAADWNAVDGASRAWLQVNGLDAVEVTYAPDAAAGTAYGAYWANAGPAGAKTVGLSAPSGQRWQAAAVEILGSAGGGGGDGAAPVIRVVPSAAVVRASTW